MRYLKDKETDPPDGSVYWHLDLPPSRLYKLLLNEHQFFLAATRRIDAEQMLRVDGIDATTANALGQHLLAEFKVDPDPLQGAQLKDIIYCAAKASGATILKSAAFDLHPVSDASGIVVIEESHFIYHYLPEHRLLAFDAFTCGDINFQAAIDVMQHRLEAKPYDTVEFKRGIRRNTDARFVEGIASLSDTAKLLFFKKPQQPPLTADQQAIGQHIIAELNCCHRGRLNDANFILETFHDALVAGGGIVLNSRIREHSPLLSYVHEFTPQGVTAVVVGAGYHLTVHDWPEFGYAALDLCVFNKKMNLDVIMQHIINAFQPQSVAMQAFPRGVYEIASEALQPVFSHYLPAASH